jgi:hypothetical protein
VQSFSICRNASPASVVLYNYRDILLSLRTHCSLSLTGGEGRFGGGVSASGPTRRAKARPTAVQGTSGNPEVPHSVATNHAVRRPPASPYCLKTDVWAVQPDNPRPRETSKTPNSLLDIWITPWHGSCSLKGQNNKARPPGTGATPSGSGPGGTDCIPATPHKAGLGKGTWQITFDSQRSTEHCRWITRFCAH